MKFGYLGYRLVLTDICFQFVKVWSNRLSYCVQFKLVLTCAHLDTVVITALIIVWPRRKLTEIFWNRSVCLGTILRLIFLRPFLCNTQYDLLLKGAGGGVLICPIMKMGFIVIFERGEWDLPTAFYLIRNINPTQSYRRSKVSAYV